MPEDSKAKARKEVRRAQLDFEQAQDKLEQRREARRRAFERAQAAGLSTREIAEETGIHFTRVARVLQTKP
jgi:DNA-directed RNA polymerase specialized sigma24 family protein